jgi:ribosomal protein S18 acetylase RimI-like enzyme
MGVVAPKKFEGRNGVEFTVRSAKTKDAASVRLLAKAIMAELEFGITEPDEFTVNDEEELAFIEKLNSGETGLALVAEVEGKVVGFLDFQTQGNRRRLSHVQEFGLAIDKDFRDAGIGRRMLEVLIEFAERTPQIEKIALSVLATNERAIHLYQTLGFKEEGRLIRAIKLGPDKYVDDVRMYKWVK